MSIDAAKMNEVFKYLKIKNHSWEEVYDHYENWEDHYKHDHHRNLTVKDIKAISVVYEWKSNDIYKQRAQFSDFLAKNKEFYNDDLKIVIQRMISKRDELSEQYGIQFPYINWLPEYGGLMQDQKNMRNRESECRNANNLPYILYDH